MSAETGTTPVRRVIRCAIYTRKSSEEGLEQEFNSLDAQREGAEAFIASQREQGWRAVKERFDDGGYSGATMERPALARLLAAVESRAVDCVVVYKVDRLSRSLLDFSKMLAMFDRQETIFVSVTQQFNTSTSLGRLTLHILLSFAQFEREIIGERTRDKMSAARRKGKWTGGYPVLGYEVAAGGGRLVIHEGEAQQVRAMFAKYAELSSLSRMVEECECRGWKTKEWKSRRGGAHPARAYTEAGLARLLGNVTYKGAVRHKGEVLAGEQEEIVTAELFDRVGRLLSVPRRREVRVKAAQRPLLEGLLRCGPCESAMGHSYCTKQGRRHCYYVCGRAQAKGWRHCPSKSLGAETIEKQVVEAVLGKARTWLWTNRQSAAGKLEVEAGVAVLSGGGQERARALGALLESVTYDGRRRKLRFRLRFDECASEQHVVKGRRGRSALMETAGDDVVTAAVPRIARLMALAIKFEGLVKEGAVQDYSQLAQLGCVTASRITQIMNLLHLSPQLQERLLFESGGQPIPERSLRKIAGRWRWDEQQRAFDILLAEARP